VLDDGAQKRAGNAAAAPFRQDEHVGHVAEHSVVRDDTTESNLLTEPIGTEAERVRDAELDDGWGPPLGPVGRSAQELVHEPDIDPGAVRGDLEFWVRHLSMPPASVR